MRVVTAVFLMVALCSTASAEKRRRAYRVRAERDVPVFLTGLSLTLTAVFRKEVGPVHCAPQCDEDNLNALDRPFAGTYRPEWDHIGDYTLYGMLAGTTALLLVVEPTPRDALLDGVVIAEAVLWTKGIQMIAAYAADRPRPLVYGDSAPLSERNSGESGQSLLSGHTTYAFALASATWATASRIDPDLSLPVGITGGLVASFVGVSRIASGHHFPSDVIMGAIFGTGMGLMLPGLHERLGDVDVVPAVAPQAATLQLRTTF